MTQNLLRLLRNYVSSYRPTVYLFNGQYGGRYSSESINSMLKYHAQKAKIKKRVHAHALRHTFGTHLLDVGSDMSIIQKAMGHANVKTTARYARMADSVLKRLKLPCEV